MIELGAINSAPPIRPSPPVAGSQAHYRGPLPSFGTKNVSYELAYSGELRRTRSTPPEWTSLQQTVSTSSFTGRSVSIPIFGVL